MQPMVNEFDLQHAPGYPGLVLTSHRVRLRSKSNGSEEMVSIMLDQITSCRLARQSQPVLLVIAAVCGLGGLLLGVFGIGSVGPMVLGLLLAAILVAAYFGSRREELVLSSANGSIAVVTRGVDVNATIAFVDAVEAAKNLRYLGRAP